MYVRIKGSGEEERAVVVQWEEYVLLLGSLCCVPLVVKRICNFIPYLLPIRILS